ncbi:DsbA family protein [Halomarina salina]|uniref:DsbA family protein n=1 Tax=Halomarina salina TaxID=1872699 RepID=A0ABD5RJL1_9EURY|nr:thioredoxin domain-containing protein [Halomarina salina]
MTSTRRRFLLAGGAVAATGLTGCLSSGSADLPDDVPDTAVTNAPVPNSPGDYDYATMGSGDNPTVVYFGDWKCPHCATFSTNVLPTIVSEFVEPGDLDLRFRAWNIFQNDDVRAARAGLGVWNVDPATYWTFHEYVMANQAGPHSQEWATTDWLTTAAEKVGVSDVDAVRSQIENEQFGSLFSDSQNAARQFGLQGTPGLIVDGQRVRAMESEALPESTRNALEQFASQ